MSPERRTIKRGDPFPSPRDEAKSLGPYPTWDNWKHILFNRFPDLILISNGTEELFRKLYIARRLYQLSGDPNRFNEWNDEVQETQPDFQNAFNEQIGFVVKRTAEDYHGKR